MKKLLFIILFMSIGKLSLTQVIRWEYIDSVVNVNLRSKPFVLRHLIPDSVTFYFYKKGSNETVRITTFKLKPDFIYNYLFIKGQLARVDIVAKKKPKKHYALLYFYNGYLIYEDIKGIATTQDSKYFLAKSEELYKESIKELNAKEAN